MSPNETDNPDNRKCRFGWKIHSIDRIVKITEA